MATLQISLPLHAYPNDNERLTDFLEHFYRKNQGFYKIPYERQILKNIKKFTQNFPPHIKYIVVLGIGGSGLGPRTILEAFEKNYPTKADRKFFVLDNVDPTKIMDVEDQIDLEKTIFITITKSGGTAETMSQYFYFSQKICGKNLEPKDHFIFISDQGSSLHKRAEEMQAPYFPIPKDVGGRFSVLTPVGLLMAELMGLNTDDFLQGAQEVADKFQKEIPHENICFQVARFLHEQHHDYLQKKTWVLFPYSERLKSFGEWFVQLVGESTGKLDRFGKKVGITPMTATGARDQHSVLQLFAEGPEDKIYTFLKIKTPEKDLTIPQISEEQFQYLSQKSFHQLLNAELDGTLQSLKERELPVFSIEIDHLEEKTLGALFFFFEGVTAFLGEFLDIDAFDQPGVERSKVLTRESMKRL